MGIYYAASADDGAVDQHHQPVRKENTKLFPGFQVRNKNITMEEVSYLVQFTGIANVGMSAQTYEREPCLHTSVAVPG